MVSTGLLLFGLALPAPVMAQSSSSSAAAATVGAKRITMEEFNRKFEEVRNQTQNPPTRKQFLEDLVRMEVGIQEAEKRGLDKDPIFLDRVRQELYRTFLEEALGERVQNIKVSDDDMKRYYAKNPEVRASHILIEIKVGATAEQRAAARKRAEEILKDVRSSKRPFEELVRLYTDDPLTKQAGGDIGFQSRGTLLPSYYEAVLSMRLGEVRGLVESPFGFHIIKKTGQRSYENANKRALRIAVFDSKRQEIFNEFFEALKRRYEIKVNPSAVN